MYDANLTLQIDSIGTPLGTGNITIQLKKEDLSSKIDDYVLLNYFSEFDNTTAFTHEKFFDISEYVNNDSIYQFYGKYVLSIQIHGTHLFDEFKVSDFFIQTDTFVQASTSDTEGWITNPAKKDTDDDGWDDYVEIFTKQTNPFQVDTDGDGA